MKSVFFALVIQPHQVGLWHVDVLGPDGELLQTLEFEITPQIEKGPNGWMS